MSEINLHDSEALSNVILQCRSRKLPAKKYSILVFPIPPRETGNSILSYLQSFGQIRRYAFGPNYVHILYKERQPVDYLLNNPIHMNGWKLNIYPYNQGNNGNQKAAKKKDKKKNKKQELLLRSGSDLLDIELKKLNTFEEQLEKLMNLTRPDENQLTSANEQIHADLQKVLSVSFPRGKIFPYGSSVVGLALIGSDLDFFFDGSGLFKDSNKIQHQVDYPASEETFEKILKILEEHTEIFQEIKSIIYKSVKIPVIKFNHRPTNTDCDISVKHGFGIFNSQLVKFCLTLDSRIKPLIIIIKCWAKDRNLYGKGKIINYALIMLIFFYLQQSEIRLIPLMKDLKAGESFMYKGCNVNFNENFPSTTSNCSKTIPELLRGFFQFYFSFQFAENIICPFTGATIKKYKVLLNRILKPQYPDLETFACFQDPIQLNNNILIGWRRILAGRLQSACKQAIDKISNVEDKFILPKLFEKTLKK